MSQDKITVKVSELVPKEIEDIVFAEVNYCVAITPQRISENIGISWAYVKAALDRLRKDGKVQQYRNGRYIKTRGDRR